jgi:hypothetical protein
LEVQNLFELIQINQLKNMKVYCAHVLKLAIGSSLASSLIQQLGLALHGLAASLEAGITIIGKPKSAAPSITPQARTSSHWQRTSCAPAGMGCQRPWPRLVS